MQIYKKIVKLQNVVNLSWISEGYKESYNTNELWGYKNYKFTNKLSSYKSCKFKQKFNQQWIVNL